ncbi:MAG: erythronate-4-phosphate dehydrogenase [Bacteroides sp.]|nr:erythronate-4-phosphate dehydrogenase [Bacteroides sp.]
MKAVIDDKIPFIKGAVETLVDEVVYLRGSAITSADVRDADILIVRTRTCCNRDLLQGSKVRLVVTATIGYDHIDTEYCREAGIRWANCPGCNAASVRQYIHNSLLVLGLLCPGITIGVVGVGHVGELVAADCRAAGMDTLLCDPLRRDRGETFNGQPFVDMEEIARNADIVTFHTPLTHTGKYPTYHLADSRFFDSLLRRPVLVNTSRGAVVDNEALLKALCDGRVREAVVDTWENEPEISAALLDKVAIGTPHIAGYSADGKANATRMALAVVCDFLGCACTFDIQPPELPEELRPTSDNPNERALQLYDPRVDSRRLKACPSEFEYFRGNYALRREFE